MKQHPVVSRRQLITSGAISTLAAPAILKARSPNNTIGLAVLGFGIRARNVVATMGHVHPKQKRGAGGYGVISREDRVNRGYGGVSPEGAGQFKDVEVRAVCDIWEDGRAYAKEMFGNRLKTPADYRQVLQDPDIDAVFIMTPDHWHAQMGIDAAGAGKDVFIEKCPTRSVEEGVALKKAVENAGSILQLNESVHQNPLYHKMREIVQSGMLGPVRHVETHTYRNTASGAWQYPIPSNLTPETIDWKEFLGPAPYRPFDAERIIRWRCYWDYSTGIAGDMFSHRIGAVNLVMGTHIPQTASASGGVYHWHDGRETPDVYHAVNEYPDRGLTITYSANLATTNGEGTIYRGADAAMTGGKNGVAIYAEPSSRKYASKFKSGEYQRGKPSEVIPVELPTHLGPQWDRVLHLREFFDCMRSRKQPSCGMHECFGEDISCHLGTLAYMNKRQMTWDADRLRAV
jgi:predicted dehydrogenase